jgi:chemotaxis protein CheZ
MPVQRKVFRIEQTNAIAAPAAEGATSAPQPSELPADLGAAEMNGLNKIAEKTDAIHNAIVRTKQEIAILHAGTFTDGRPRATRELDAVANGAERATQQILDAAEVIEESAKLLSASVKQTQEQELTQDIQDHVLRIFEACNFQDLSGQRITKVLAMLAFVEDRISRTMEIWGGADAFKDCAAAVAEGVPDPTRMHGPKLDGDAGHASQSDVDSMFRAG